MSYNTIHSAFKLNGVHYNIKELKVLANNYILKGKAYQKVIGNFLIDWLNDEQSIIVNTSGSSGKPKQIQLQKQAMVNSALATGNFFNLKASNRALLCLPVNYIAGKMMLVRAMVLGLEIDSVEPTTNPKFDLEVTYDFSAMIPLQLSNCKYRLSNITTLIVGGAPVSNGLKKSIQKLSTRIFETYGMTETITHIALKPLNNFYKSSCHSEHSEESIRHVELVSASHFKVLQNITISQDNRDCLVINAPKISKETIITNDVVKLRSHTEFQWLGRYDNVINSGGLKLFPEQIEAKLQSKISRRFFITSEKDEELGSKVILVIEGESYQLKPDTFSSLSKYEKPKEVYFVDKFVETSSGKVQRKQTHFALKR